MIDTDYFLMRVIIDKTETECMKEIKEFMDLGVSGLENVSVFQTTLANLAQAGDNLTTMGKSPLASNGLETR
jgi:hypothetical protein